MKKTAEVDRELVSASPSWQAQRAREQDRKRRVLESPLAVSVLATLPGHGLRISVADLAATAMECDGLAATEKTVSGVLRRAQQAGFPVNVTPTRGSACAAWGVYDRRLLEEAFDLLCQDGEHG